MHNSKYKYTFRVVPMSLFNNYNVAKNKLFFFKKIMYQFLILKFPLYYQLQKYGIIQSIHPTFTKPNIYLDLSFSSSSTTSPHTLMINTVRTCVGGRANQSISELCMWQTFIQHSPNQISTQIYHLTHPPVLMPS